MAKTVKQCIIRWCIDYSYLSGIGQFHPTLTKCPDGYRSPRTTGNRSGRWSSISVPGVLFLRFYATTSIDIVKCLHFHYLLWNRIRRLPLGQDILRLQHYQVMNLFFHTKKQKFSRISALFDLIILLFLFLALSL